MAQDPKLAHLAQVRLFSSCTKKELEQISRASDEITVPAGKELVTEGQYGHEFFLILDGTATVRRNGRKVATLGTGQYFGELAVLSRSVRNATVTADTPLTVLVLGQREFAAVVESVPRLASKLLNQMAERLREADERALSH